MTTMNQTTHSTAQATLARLVVNPPAALHALRGGCPGDFGILLSPDERAELGTFLESYGQAFRASVLMLRKRRLDNILDALTVTPRLFSEYELSCYWDDYLLSVATDAPTHKNPLLESILFGRFVIQALPSGDVHSALVEYDVTRNEVAATAAADVNRYPVHEADERVALFLHPAWRVAGFSINVAAMVKAVMSGRDRNAVLSSAAATPERILFFRNWKRGGVGTLKVNAAVEQSLELFDGRRPLGELLAQQPHLSGLIQSLDTAGVIAACNLDLTHKD